MADDKEQIKRIMDEFGVPESEARDILAIERGDRLGDIKGHDYTGGNLPEDKAE